MNTTLERPVTLETPCDEGDWDLPCSDECKVGEEC